ncbi:hypothetical protein EDM68_03310 [Candidatus Uhrbacteria bacterium]|nr:MAG: hypothetical protein EDM68_03310 [Candidatus Uhrbacteria bacterium]
MFGLTKDELHVLRRLDTPRKVQAFLDEIPINFEPEGDTCLSPRRVMRERRAHCIEGAMLAALAFRIHGQRPLLLDLVSSDRDTDHVVALFKQHGCWGAVSKTNHAVLRYREPVYKTIRELALSYFHEYFDPTGFKTLRTYSRPMDLSRFDRDNWVTSEEDNWFVVNHLFDTPHIPLLSRRQIATLNRAHPVEIKAGEITEWTPRTASSKARKG